MESPRSDLERAVMAIWNDVGIPASHRDSDFFELGGTSIVMLRVTSQLEARLGVAVALNEMFEHSTVAALAAHVETLRGNASLEGATPKSIVATGRRKGRLLAPQRGTYLLSHAAPNNAQNRMLRSIWLDGPLDIPALERALHTLHQRHAILRTRFFEEDGELWQEIVEANETVLERADVSTIAESERERIDTELVDAALLRPFDLARGETSRALLTSWSPVRHRLSLVFHHIACDPHSLDLYESELHRLWRAYVVDPTSAETLLAPPTATSVDLVDYLERFAATPAGERQRAYWRSQLDGATPIVLPSDRPREAADAHRAAHDGFVTFPIAPLPVHELGAEQVAALNALARKANVSVLSVLLAMFSAELSSVTGQTDLSIVSHLLFRHLPGLERSMGFFSNALLLRVSMSDADSDAERIARTHQTVTAAFEHGAFDVLREASRLFRVYFNYQQVAPASTTQQEHMLPPGVSRQLAPFLRSQRSEAAYDLVLFVFAFPERIQLRLQYNVELFREATAAALLARFAARIQAVTAGSVGKQ